ncbi:MAG: tryptophan--tRNA ligase, partial [Tenuifilaceae bacterium]|jgi:tryptophanyl-tRNA synthetase|nr:tryptophan--tRNA ligase [Tenuifilaceae bacterium]
MNVVSSADTQQYFNDKYNSCEIRYGDMKKQLAEDIVAFTEPFYTRIESILADTDYLRRVAKMGAEKARESATRTIREVREIIGFRQF